MTVSSEKLAELKGQAVASYEAVQALMKDTDLLRMTPMQASFGYGAALGALESAFRYIYGLEQTVEASTVQVTIDPARAPLFPLYEEWKDRVPASPLADSFRELEKTIALRVEQEVDALRQKTGYQGELFISYLMDIENHTINFTITLPPEQV